MSQHRSLRQHLVSLVVGTVVVFSAAVLLTSSNTKPSQPAENPIAPVTVLGDKTASFSPKPKPRHNVGPKTSHRGPGNSAKKDSPLPSSALAEKMPELSAQLTEHKGGGVSSASFTPEEKAAYQAAGVDSGFPYEVKYAPRYWYDVSVVSTASPGDTVTYNLDLYRSHPYVKLDFIGWVYLRDGWATPIGDIPWSEVYLYGHPDLAGDWACALMFQTDRSHWQGGVQLASTSTDVTDTATGNGVSTQPSISSDGRYVAFTSSANNFGPTDTNGVADIYVRDTTTNKVVRASLGNSGAEPNAACGSPSISSDGRYVAFTSSATNLTSKGGNGRVQVYVRDMQLNTTTLVSVDGPGALSTADALDPSISGDRQRIAFSTSAHLVAADSDSLSDIYVRDIAASTTSRVSYAASTSDSNGENTKPAISQDGDHVAFLSWAKNLTVTPVGPGAQVFVRDLSSGSIQVVSVSSAGVNADGTCTDRPAISADGNRIAFVTDASNLGIDTNGFNDVYLRDIAAGTTSRVSVSSVNDGWDSLGFDYHTGAPTISPDGRFIGFQSENPNLDSAASSQYLNLSPLVPSYFPDANGVMDVFVRDTDSANPSTVRASLRRDGAQISSPSTAPSISNTARVAFVTDATGLMADAPVTTDANGVADVYVADFRLTKISVPVHFKLGAADLYEGNTPADWELEQLLAPNSTFSGIIPDPGSLSGTLNISVAPKAADDQVQGRMGTSIPIDVLANDTINNPITDVTFTRPAHGSVIWNQTTQLAYYTPDPSFIGTDTFTYRSTDGALFSQPATITAHVLGCVPSNDTAVTSRNTAASVDVLANDRYETTTAVPAGQVVDAPAHGSATYNNTTGKVTYTPANGYVGADSFTYRLFDGYGWSPAVSVTMKVAGGTASPDAATVLVNTPATIDVVANDAFVPTSTVAVGQISAAPANGTAVWDAVTGRVTYAPKTDFVGSDTFSYRLFDGVAWTAPALVSVDVVAGNVAPIANDDSASTDASVPLSIDVLANDSDANGDKLTIVLDGHAPASGTYAISGGHVLYTPKADFNGTDTFTYRVSDTGGLFSNYANVTVTVRALNTPPVAHDDAYHVAEDETGSFAVLSNDTDADGDTLTPSVVTGPSHGSVVWNATTRSFDYTPEADYNGTDSFTYRDYDGKEYSRAATVNIVVDPVNDAPVAHMDSASTTKGSVVIIDVLGNDTDVDGDALSGDISSGPSHGSVTALANGSVRYTPEEGFTGTDSFTYRAFDGHLYSNTAAVTITVTGGSSGGNGGHGGSKKQVIRAYDHSVWTRFEKTVSIPLRSHVTDVLGRSLTVSIVGVPSHGEVTLSGGTVVYVPDAGFSGTDVFTYRATDGSVYSNTARITMHVGKPQANKPKADKPKDKEPETVEPSNEATDAPVESASTPTVTPAGGSHPSPGFGDKALKWLENNVTPCSMVGLLLFVVLVGVFFRLFARRQMREDQEA